MKRLALKSALAGMLALGLLAGPAGASTAKLPAGVNTDKHETTVVIEGYTVGPRAQRGTPPPSTPVTFYGHVECVDVCLVNRKVTLKNTDVPVVAGTDKTDADGNWSITFEGNDIPPGKFKAVADRKAIKKRRKGEVVKRTVCKRGVGTYDVLNPPHGRAGRSW